MKKISVKQLLVNAMEEYGNSLILSERFWFWLLRVLSRPKIERYEQTYFLEVTTMSMKENLIRGMQTIGQMRAVIGE